MIAGVTGVLILILVHDFLSDWYKSSQPAATLQVVCSEESDKSTMDAYNNILRLGGRIVDRMAGLDGRRKRQNSRNNMKMSQRSVRLLI